MCNVAIVETFTRNIQWSAVPFLRYLEFYISDRSLYFPQLQAFILYRQDYKSNQVFDPDAQQFFILGVMDTFCLAPNKKYRGSIPSPSEKPSSSLIEIILPFTFRLLMWNKAGSAEFHWHWPNKGIHLWVKAEVLLKRECVLSRMVGMTWLCCCADRISAVEMHILKNLPCEYNTGHFSPYQYILLGCYWGLDWICSSERCCVPAQQNQWK